MKHKPTLSAPGYKQLCNGCCWN